MIRHVFCTFDKTAGVYQNMFVELNSGTAIRGFSAAVNTEKSQFAKYPDDYILYELGPWDDVSGKIESFAEPKRLVSAREVLTNAG